MTTEAKYLYHNERVEWVAVIYDDEEPNVILDIGCEMTETAIEDWITLALKNEPWVPGNPAAPDMYDRARRH